MIINRKEPVRAGYSAFIFEICPAWGRLVVLWGLKMGGYNREIGMRGGWHGGWEKEAGQVVSLRLFPLIFK